MINKQTFAQNLELGTKHVRENTRRYCDNDIPEASRYRIQLNSSFDGHPLRKNEKLFPDHDVPQTDGEEFYTSDEVVDRLWRDGYIPEWIDITPLEVLANTCHYELRCCGRFTTNDEMLYHRREGYPPFHCFGPILPRMDYDLEKNGKFDLHHYRDRKKKRI